MGSIFHDRNIPLYICLYFGVVVETALSYLFMYFTYSRWTSSLPSCLWPLRIFPSLPGSHLTISYRDANSAILQLVNKWLNFTYFTRTLATTPRLLKP